MLVLAEGEFDAAEIDKELISSRLRQDVMEHSGKAHLFIADNVRFHLVPILHVFHSFTIVRLCETTRSGSTHPWAPFFGYLCCCIRRRQIPIYGRERGFDH